MYKTTEHQIAVSGDAHPAAVGAVLGVLLVAVEEDLLPVHQGRQLLRQLGGGTAPASHVQPYSERSHQPAAAHSNALREQHLVVLKPKICLQPCQRPPS